MNETLKRDGREKFVNISIGSLKWISWDSGLYPSRGIVERSLYASLKEFIDQKIDEFKRKHGGAITPVMLLKGHVARLVCLNEEVCPGYRVEMKKT